MDFENHDFCSSPKGEAAGTHVDSLSPRSQSSFSVSSETDASTSKTDVRLDCGWPVNLKSVLVSSKDVPPPKGRQCETVPALASPIPSHHSLVVPVAQRSISETVGYRSLAREVSAPKRDLSETTSTPHPSYFSQPQSPTASRVSSSNSELQGMPPLVGTRCSDSSDENAPPVSPQDSIIRWLQSRNLEQWQSAQPTPSQSRISATLIAGTVPPGRQPNTPLFDDGAIPISESRGTLFPRSLGPRRKTLLPMCDETRGAPTDVTSADRSDIDPGSVTADQSLEQDSPRPPTSALTDAFAEDPYAAARVPWATLAVLYLQAQAHWNFLHKHYPERCASVETVLLERQWQRLIFAAFHHIDVSHLSCDMFFFFFKGLVLEAALGPVHFLALLAVVVLLVGLADVFLVLVLCELYGDFSVCGMCMHTLAGVVVALDMIIRGHLGDTRICYGDLEFRTRPRVCSLIELIVICSFSEKNSVAISCGLVVGSLLSGPMLGSLIVRTPNPPRYIYLRVVPNAPVTYVLFAAVVIAFMCGPYPDTSTAAGATLTFSHPVWKPPVLWALYLEDAYQVTYIGLSLLAVGTALERELGHCRLHFSPTYINRRFLCLTCGLLLAGHVCPKGLSWILQNYAVALEDGVKFSVRSSSSVLVGALLALKTIQHEKRRYNGSYQVALFNFAVPFWAGVLLELVYLHFLILNASTTIHVAGLLVGLIAAHCREVCSCFLGWIRKRPRRRCSSCSALFDEEREETPATPLTPSQSANIWCQVCAARTASPTAYRVPEMTVHRSPEVSAEDTSSKDPL
ncbi:hypothetical protein HPB51_018402 [Rhipicephalus microplus]|uniref:Peptidase S54 rhomboid domain-containing protein n=1 Tax=Rhipicephalus microplus TaxID=6941 RepID=A0A9J6EUE0_RHIMP|nr:hypothetical protein HPB51_018402 [Rhipicephalus microplus]